jgi:hypothetical protein
MSNKLTTLAYDGKTGKTIEREMTKEEEEVFLIINSYSEQQQAESVARVAAKQSALAKLAALGLTEEEIAAL